MKRVILPICLLLIWEVVAVSVDRFYFPTLEQIFYSFFDDLTSGQLITDIRTSAERFLIGLSLSLPIGMLIGTGIGSNKQVREFFLPTINAFRVLPPSALIPLVIMTIGVNSNSVIFMIFLSSVVPILIATVDGISAAVEKFKPLVLALELNTLDSIRKVYAPAAGKQIFTGADLSVTMAFRMLVFAEFMGVSSGIGFRLVDSATYLSYTRVYYLLGVLSFFGLLLFFAMAQIKKRIFSWE